VEDFTIVVTIVDGKDRVSRKLFVFKFLNFLNKGSRIVTQALTPACDWKSWPERLSVVLNGMTFLVDLKRCGEFPVLWGGC
jgi:hypothetical protein